MYVAQDKLESTKIWIVSGAYAEGWLGARAPPPPPHPGKKFRSEMSKRGEKVPPRYVGKKEMCTFRTDATN